jgi:hypothetical protein
VFRILDQDEGLIRTPSPIQADRTFVSV